MYDWLLCDHSMLGLCQVFIVVLNVVEGLNHNYRYDWIHVWISEVL